MTPQGAILENGAISLSVDAALEHLAVRVPAQARTLELGRAFGLELSGGGEVHPGLMEAESPLQIETLKAEPTASKLSSRFPGKSVCAAMRAKDHSWSAHWCAILRDGSSYLREELTVLALEKPLPLSKVRMLTFSDPGARVEGSVHGSPVVDTTMYFGFEDPSSESEVHGSEVSTSLARQLPLEVGKSVTYSAVAGAAPRGQLRRSFLGYLERERAHPYRTFLHYNTWYDLGFGNRFDEAGVLDRIQTFGQELVQKRGVVMDSFLLDDGWDDANTVWGVNPGFPNGFTRVRDAAGKYKFGIGLWMSPWGGYLEAKASRVATGSKQGYEVLDKGFALSGSRYYSHFEQTCLNMIDQYGINQFKFDGMGNANRVFPGSRFDSDYDAAIGLIQRLRQDSPNLYVNLTFGTYASPFWLRYADSIWRGGKDNGFAGVGSFRQRWITFRDADTYKHVVSAGPLFPLNSLMLHGIIYARQAEHLDVSSEEDFTDEVRSYFGSGTQLQEMYITPSLLTTKEWDTLAASARWSRSHASVLKDTHWVGGDPAKLEVYGWGAWNDGSGIMTLRNPSDKEQSIVVDIGKVFELPEGARSSMELSNPWKAQDAARVHVQAGREHTFILRPFEVLTLQTGK